MDGNTFSLECCYTGSGRELVSLCIEDKAYMFPNPVLPCSFVHIQKLFFVK